MSSKVTALEFQIKLLESVVDQQRREIERLKLERDDALFDPWRGRDVNTRSN